VSLRDRKILAGVAVLAAIVAVWLMVIQPKRAQVSKLDGQVNAAQSQLNSARAQLEAGQSARATFARSYTLLARLGEAVPADDNVPSLIYQVQSSATSARVDFQSLALSSNGSSGSGGSSSPSASQAATANLPPGATVGPAGFPLEPFNFTFQGNFFHLADFFGRLQALVRASNKRVGVSGRLITLNAISLNAASGGFPQITATIAASAYLLPPSEGLTNGATPAGPSGGAATPIKAQGGGGVPGAPAAISLGAR